MDSSKLDTALHSHRQPILKRCALTTMTTWPTTVNDQRRRSPSSNREVHETKTHVTSHLKTENQSNAKPLSRAFQEACPIESGLFSRCNSTPVRLERWLTSTRKQQGQRPPEGLSRGVHKQPAVAHRLQQVLDSFDHSHLLLVAHRAGYNHFGQNLLDSGAHTADRIPLLVGSLHLVLSFI